MTSGEPTKGLVIDDDVKICFYIQDTLERSPWARTTAANGQDALHLMDQAPLLGP